MLSNNHIDLRGVKSKTAIRELLQDSVFHLDDVYILPEDCSGLCIPFEKYDSSGVGQGYGYNFNKCGENWDVSHVTDMSCMFTGSDINDLKVQNWDVRNVLNMSYMFFECVNFEAYDHKKNVSYFKDWRPINVWSVDKMFYRCKKLYQPKLNHLDKSIIRGEDTMYLGCDLVDVRLKSYPRFISASH